MSALQLGLLKAQSKRPEVDNLHKAVPLAVAGDKDAQRQVCGVCMAS